MKSSNTPSSSINNSNAEITFNTVSNNTNSKAANKSTKNSKKKNGSNCNTSAKNNNKNKKKRKRNKRKRNRYPENGLIIPILGIVFIVPNRNPPRDIKINKNVVENFRMPGPLATSGYLAAKAKVAGERKAARKERNLDRLVRQYNPPTILTKHAAQRYRERGPSSIPVYKYEKHCVSERGGSKDRSTIVTFIPINKYRAREARDTLVNEAKYNNHFSKRSQLPKDPLSWREATILRKTKDWEIKAHVKRRGMQREMRAEYDNSDPDFFIQPDKREV